MSTPNDTRTDAGTLARAWLHQQPVGSKITALIVFYWLAGDHTRPLAEALLTEFQEEVFEALCGETSPLDDEEKVMAGYFLAQRQEWIARDRHQQRAPLSATTRRDGDDHAE